jgi:hypothetical protein
VEEPIEKRRFDVCCWKTGEGIHASPSMDLAFPPLRVYGQERFETTYNLVHPVVKGRPDVDVSV